VKHLAFVHDGQRVRVPLILVAALLLLMASCDWPMFRYGPDHTGSSPDTSISKAAVASLVPDWTATTGSVVRSSPAVANGVVYVGSGDGKLYAFDAAGSTNCTVTPTSCNPLWTGTAGNAVFSSPAVANGRVYVGSDDSKLYAFGLEKIPPETSVVQPANAATLAGTTALDATASDDVSVSKVEFDLTRGTDTTLIGFGSPNGSGHWAYTWDTTTTPNGTYPLNSVAYDRAGNVGRSANVTITIQN